jgi:hypothetical protein
MKTFLIHLISAIIGLILGLWLSDIVELKAITMKASVKPNKINQCVKLLKDNEIL